MVRSLAGSALASELLLLGLLSLLWGSSYVFIKLALEGLPPLTLIAIRVCIAAGMLLVLVRLRRDSLPRDPGSWWMLGVQAVCNSIGAWTLLAWGQQHVDSAVAGVLNSTAPVFVLLITVTFTRHEPAGPRRLAGALLGLGGVIVILGDGAVGGPGRELLAESAVLASAPVTAAATMLLAAVTLTPLAIVVDRPWTLRPEAHTLLAALALGVLCTGLAMLVYFRLIATLGSLGTASQAYLRAGVSVLLGWLVLGETIAPAVGLGMGLALAGVVLINLPGRMRGTGPAREMR